MSARTLHPLAIGFGNYAKIGRLHDEVSAILVMQVTDSDLHTTKTRGRGRVRQDQLSLPDCQMGQVLRQTMRPCLKHMLPVLIEHDLNIEVG
jgi:hypothetical protein